MCVTTHASLDHGPINNAHPIQIIPAPLIPVRQALGRLAHADGPPDEALGGLLVLLVLGQLPQEKLHAGGCVMTM